MSTSSASATPKVELVRRSWASARLELRSGAQRTRSTPALRCSLHPHICTKLAGLIAPVLQLVSTSEELAAALSVRRCVFIDEQGVSPELEIDEHDVLGGDTTHVIALLDEQVVAAARLRPVGTQLGKLERIAVLSEHRGRGLGIALTRYLEDLALQRGLVRLTMNAQQSACGFYAKLGYSAVGPEFLEADIVHQKMEKSL